MSGRLAFHSSSFSTPTGTSRSSSALVITRDRTWCIALIRPFLVPARSSADSVSGERVSEHTYAAFSTPNTMLALPKARKEGCPGMLRRHSSFM